LRVVFLIPLLASIVILSLTVSDAYAAITEIIDATGDTTGNTLSSSHGIDVDGTGNVYVSGASSTNAFKITLAVPVGGTGISPDTVSLLAYGVQSSISWWLPAVLAGVGIGVFVIKKRNSF